MTNAKQRTDLSPFFEAVEGIPDKNRGGCLFFAYVFWLWLKENNLSTESFEIVQFEDEWQSNVMTQRNLKWIKNKGEGVQATSSTHFGWLYEGELLDSEGPVDDDRWKNGVTLSGLNGSMCPLVEYFCVDSLNGSSWNRSFDRNSAIDILSEKFGIDLYDVQF